MLYFLLFIILGYRKNVHVYSYVKQSSLQSFGFDNKGNFSYIFTIPESFTDEFKLVHLNITTYSQQKKDFLGYFDLCSNQLILNQGVTINRTINKFSGVIKFKTIIYPYLLRCDSDDSTDVKINLLVQYQNPSTFLDLRIQPEIKIQLIISILFIVLFIMVAINWILHFKFNIYLYQCLTYSILFYAISHILRCCELSFLNKSDNSHHLSQFHMIFIWISYFLTTLFLLLMSHGLNIITDVVPIPRFIVYLSVSIWITIFSILYLFYDLGPNSKFILILIIIGAFVFITLMFTNIRSSKQQILSILIKPPASISNDLVYLIHGIYSWFIFDILVICFMLAILVIIYISCPQWDIWALEVTISFIELISLSLFAFHFRLRPKRMSYQTVTDEIPLGNVDTSSVDQPLLKPTIE